VEKGGEKRFLKPLMARFEGTRLKDITPAAVSEFALEKYGHLQPASVKRFLYTPLNAVMRAGHRAQLCPLVRFDPPKVPKKPVEYADDKWLRTFLEYAHARIALTVLFMTLTATRVSEACRVTLGDVDLARGFAILRQTKSGKSRKVMLPPLLVEPLRQWIADNRLENEADRLFGYADRWSVNQAIKRTCKKAGIKYLSSHKAGRHAFAARLLAEGKSLRFVQEGGGWASIQIVAETYGHLEQSMIDSALKESGDGFIGKIGLGSKTLALTSSKTNGHVSGTLEILELEESEKTEQNLVGATGIEPVTPTMSRMVTSTSRDGESP
jgi:integrase